MKIFIFMGYDVYDHDDDNDDDDDDDDDDKCKYDGEVHVGDSDAHEAFNLCGRCCA